MAKGNLFLGTAARSVGDVVMYRREGSQVSRVRVRKIANPKTEAQCRQRAYMAPIPKFFSPLAVVLERSFEGLSKSKSYSKFLKVNADKARANDWLLPKGTGFFPLPYQLSQGTIPSINYSFDSSSHKISFVLAGLTAESTTIGALSTALIARGYQAGDIITFLVIGGDATTGYFPVVEQFVIDEANTTTLASYFKKLSVTISTGGQSSVNVSYASGQSVGGSIIIARFENDKWRRTTDSLLVDTAVTTAIAEADYKAAAIASYSNTVSEPNPMVYLDGDELDNA